MAVHLSCLLTLTAVTGIHSITTVSDVSVKAGDSISIPCLYNSQYKNHAKYLCEGYRWASCSYAVKTNRPDNAGKFYISDDKKQSIFTVTIKQLRNDNNDYWCAVEINDGADVREYFHLSVVRGTPSLYVDNQEVTGYIGENMTIKCHYSNSGGIRWCRLGRSCVTGLSGSIDGTAVTINRRDPNVFSVTMSGLTPESSGWYYCASGNLQMPVHVTVTKKPATSAPTLSTGDTALTSVKGGQRSASFDLKLLIIPLSLLIFIVIVALVVWFMLRRKQNKEVASTTTMQADEEVTYTTVKHKSKTSGQKRRSTQEDVTYSNVGYMNDNSAQRPTAESDVDILYSTVVTIEQQNAKAVEGHSTDVTYSTLAEHHRNI